MNTKNKLRSAENYILYYGEGREEDLARFDLAVIEPRGHTPAGVKKIKRLGTGTIVLAYLSVMEIHTWEREYRLFSAGDFLTRGAKPVINWDYGTHLLDLRSDRVKKMLLQKMKDLVFSGYDGVFLDTVGDLETPLVAAGLRDVQIMAAVEIILSMRKIYPGQVIIQNNGLEQVCLYTASLLDGICWENPDLGENGGSAWTQSVLGRLIRLKKEKNIKVLLLYEGSKGTGIKKAQQLAAEKGFLFYHAGSGYSRLSCSL